MCVLRRDLGCTHFDNFNAQLNLIILDVDNVRHIVVIYSYLATINLVLDELGRIFSLISYSSISLSYCSKIGSY